MICTQFEFDGRKVRVRAWKTQLEKWYAELDSEAMYEPYRELRDTLQGWYDTASIKGFDEIFRWKLSLLGRPKEHVGRGPKRWPRTYVRSVIWNGVWVEC